MVLSTLLSFVLVLSIHVETKFYDMSDLIRPTPHFDNAPDFSMPAGLAGTLPVLVVRSDVIRRSNQIRLENIIFDQAEFFDLTDDLNFRWWRGSTLILTGDARLHELLGGSF